MFKPAGTLDFCEIDRKILKFWKDTNAFDKLVEKNRITGKIYSFLDGPITANNPMGVHHAWGRTLKDIYQRWMAMRGYHQRYQNGFDCQGLWVEVEVEKALGLNSKREIIDFGLDNFSKACRERVLKHSKIITDQSIALGQWMDWGNDYFTMVDHNIESIWFFLKKCFSEGNLYKGYRPMPWCARCGTSLSQHEMLDSYKDMTHESVYLKLPIKEKPGEFMMVWTTTPWTLTANTALAVHPDLEYTRVKQNDEIYYLSTNVLPILNGKYENLGFVKGASLAGLHYTGPFDHFDAQKTIDHVIVPWDMVGSEEGTGVVHIAPGCGLEDYELSQKEGIKIGIVAPINESGDYIEGFGDFTGKNVSIIAPLVFESLRKSGFMYKTEMYTHRYPTCWRCDDDLVFRLVDEWFISTAPYKQRLFKANSTIDWKPDYISKRMDDWLLNMGDWCISRKRFWGLPLPFYLCKCGELTVISSKQELAEKAGIKIDDISELHRPWIDEIEIKCPKCGNRVKRITDVGDCWLDAGVVPFSTMYYFTDREEWKKWFPAELILEMRAQVRCWFYSMLFMSVVLEDCSPYKVCMTYEKVVSEDGREMHKSWGNAIWFDEAVEKMGADVMRWMYSGQPKTTIMRFGYGSGVEVKKKFLQFWNCYSFFETYANLDKPKFRSWEKPPAKVSCDLDRWIISRVQSFITDTWKELEDYEISEIVLSCEAFWDDLSNWYIRRSRRRLWKGEHDDDKQSGYETLYYALVTTIRVLAPIVPFIAEEMYQNLVRSIFADAPESVHHTEYPVADERFRDAALEADVARMRHAVSLALAGRQRSKIKVRQPLPAVYFAVDEEYKNAILKFKDDVLSELNVKEIKFVDDPDQLKDIKLMIDLRKAGPVFGKKVNSVREAIEKLDSKSRNDWASSMGNLELDVHGEKLSVPEDMIIMERVEGERFVIESDAQVLAALDTELSDDLIIEGFAREAVRRIQVHRKDIGLDVEDRIILKVSGDSVLMNALDNMREYIAQEVLAENLEIAESLDDGKEFEFGGMKLNVQIEKVQ
jgi:isoleucyl-tRNA synthetase